MRCGEEAEKRPGGGRLIRLVSWAQALLGEVLSPGDLAVDLTAGTGQDTLFLFHRVGAAGRVIAFDIQEEALQATAALLRQAGAPLQRHPADAPGALSPGVHLVADSHAAFDSWVPEAPRGIIGNLGYLPGGNPAVTTLAPSTLAALEGGSRRLQRGGRIAVTVYRGHLGGEEEGRAVGSFFAALPPRHWDVLQLELPNRPGSPVLLLAERH